MSARTIPDKRDTFWYKFINSLMPEDDDVQMFLNVNKEVDENGALVKKKADPAESGDPEVPEIEQVNNRPQQLAQATNFEIVQMISGKKSTKKEKKRRED